MQVSITLDQAHWQLAINVLGRAPFNEVAPLVLGIQQQLAQGLGMGQPARVQQRTNGAETEADAAAA